MEKYKYCILLSICLIVSLIVFYIAKGTELDIESSEVKDLYHYLGEVSDSHCGGLNTYKESTVTKDDITLEDKLCMAYFEVNDKETGEVKTTGVNKNKVKICKKGDITLTTEDNTCTYTKVSKDEINKMYNKLYGEDINEYKEFYITNKNACYLEGDSYICGSAENFSYTISAPARIYRAITRAVKKGDTIILTDYFLKVVDNKCYTSMENHENTECSAALENNSSIDVDFLKKYGTVYEHTYHKEKNTPYYWIKSSQK